jgi:hypothetical protein
VTTLNQCALLYGAPGSFEEFSEDLDLGSLRDYARAAVGIRKPLEYWSEYGVPLARAANDLFQEAEQLGVKVVRRATLPDLQALFERYSTITVFAHWRGYDLLGRDILIEPLEIVKIVRTGSGDLDRAIAARLPRKLEQDLSEIASSERRSARLASILNRHVVSAPNPLPGAVTHVRGMIAAVDQPSLASKHRELLDDRFPNCLQPGNRLELRDGLHSRDTVRSCIPQQWEGVADLATCRSYYLAHAIKDGHQDRNVTLALRALYPQTRFVIQKHLYRMIANEQVDYVATLQQIFQELQATPSALQAIWTQLLTWLRIRRLPHDNTNRRPA